MYQMDQNNMGRKFGLRPREMHSFLDVLTLFRNTCAHDGRLFNYKTSKRVIKMPIHNALGIPAGPSGNLLYGQQDLYAVTIIFKLMLKKKEFNLFFAELDSLISGLSNELHTIPIEDVLTAMGFPANWQDVKNR